MSERIGRLGIEKLAWLVSKEPGDSSIGELAARFDVEPTRIWDAIDVLKIRAGQPTQLPPVPWED